MKGKQSLFYLGIKLHRMTYDLCGMFLSLWGKNTGYSPTEGQKCWDHSLRRMTCQNVLSSGISPTLVIQITGHKNVNLLQNCHLPLFHYILYAKTTPSLLWQLLHLRTGCYMIPSGGSTISSVIPIDLDIIPWQEHE